MRIAGMTTLGSPSLTTRVVPEAQSTTASARRRNACGARTESMPPSSTPGTEPRRMFPASTKSTLPPTQWAIPGGPQQHRRVEDVGADHALGVSRKIAIRAIAISVPLPAEVRPITNPVVAPVMTAAMMWRRYRCIA